MSGAAKIWIVTAVSLILLGCMILAGVMMRLDWDFTKLSTGKFDTVEHEIKEAFSGFSIDCDTAGVEFVPSEDGKSKVVCYEQEKSGHTVQVRDGVLFIELTDTRKWYEHIGINLGTPKITLYVPEGAYGVLEIENDTGAVKLPAAFSFESIRISEDTGAVRCEASATKEIDIESDTGAIHLSNVTAGSLKLEVSTGAIDLSKVTCEGDAQIEVSTGRTTLTDLKCNRFFSEGSTGDIRFNNVLVRERLAVERSTGDVLLNASDAGELFITTDTGSVTGSLLSEKVFLTKTDTGRVRVPQSTVGGRCEITTDTGDIKIDIIK